MPSLLLRGIAAAGMWAITGIHCTATPLVMGPLEASTLIPEGKGVIWLCWHGISVFMLITDIAYTWPFLMAPQPDHFTILLLSGAWITMAGAALYKSIRNGKPTMFALQYIGLSLIPAIAICSLYFGGV